MPVSARIWRSSVKNAGSVIWRGETFTRDGQRPARHRLHPFGQLTARFQQHLPSDRNDKPAILGNGNEFAGRDDAMHRMPPADQRLDSDHTTILQADLRLILHKELRFPQRRAQIGLDLQPLLHTGVKLVVEFHQSGPAPVLGRIKRRVRLAQQLLGGFHAGLAERNPDACRHHDFFSGNKDRVGQGRKNALAQRFAGAVNRVWVKNYDFIAAKPARNILRSDTANDTPCHF